MISKPLHPEHGLMGAKVKVVAIRQSIHCHVAAWPVVHVDDALNVSHTRRRPQHGMDDRIDRGRGADTQRKC